MSYQNRESIEKQLEGYGDKLLGLIPAQKIRTLDFERASPTIISRFQAIPDLTSTVADILDALGLDTIIPASELPPVSGDRVVGSAVTLRYVPTRTSSGYSAANGHTAPLLGGRDIVTLSQTGDVLVIESNCQYAASAFGGIMATTVHEGGLAGIVVDGNIRDIGNLRKLGLPAWARGITPRTGKQRIELAELNGPVEISGVHIAPGDIVLGDADGIVIVPLHAAQEVLARAEKAVDTENSLIAALKKGATAQEVAGILSPDKW